MPLDVRTNGVVSPHQPPCCTRWASPPCGGTEGCRDSGSTERSRNPAMTFSGEDLVADVATKAAANHPFVDGNKRVGAHAALVFIERVEGDDSERHGQEFARGGLGSLYLAERLPSLSMAGLEAAGGFEPPNRGFADLRLSHLATPPELVSVSDFLDVSWSGTRDSNPRLRPWQGRTLPLS